MNILISVNENYLDKAKTMLFSLTLHCREKITVYLMNKELTNEHITAFRNFLNKKCNAELVCVDVTKIPFDDMPVVDHFSIEMYYRILAQDVLPRNVDRVLWLDADIVILKDITEFYYQDFGGNCMVVTPDVRHSEPFIQNLKEKIGLPKEHKYFNSGVLLLNLDLIRKTYSTKEIFEVCEQLKDRLTYPDQDILNWLYKDKVKYCDTFFYNYQLYEGQDLNEEEMNKVAVLHYTGFEKPWKYRTVNKFSKYYWNVQIKRKKYFTFISFMLLVNTRKYILNVYDKIVNKIKGIN